MISVAEIADVEGKMATLEGNIETNATQQAARHVKLELGRRVLVSLNNTKSVIEEVNTQLGSI
jgi:hypothetical protein